MQEPSLPPASRQGADAQALAAGRVAVLFSLGRQCLFLPFAALCVAATLLGPRHLPLFVTAAPLLLAIIISLATFRLAARFDQRSSNADPLPWARRYTVLSALAGLVWGVGGGYLWFIPHLYVAQAYLCLGLLGVTTVEFIARSAYRPAFLAFVIPALVPLSVRLFCETEAYAAMTGVLVLFFGAALYSYCARFTEMLDEALVLRQANTALVTSLSAQKQAAEEARDIAEASTRAKTVFIANISHEIRTALNALLGMAQLLERSDLDRTQKSHIQVVIEAGRGLKTLLDDVLTLSGSEIPDANLAQDCDPAETVRTVARLLQPRAWEKQLRLSISAPPTLPRAHADPRRLRQVLMKLADNALKYTDRGGVELRAEAIEEPEFGPQIRFSVIDTGLGLAREAAQHLFEPFHQSDASYAKRHDGAGLGLAVAKRLVESMHGVIGFASAPGEGATFWFAVPASGTVQSAPDISAPIAAEAPPPSGIHVLVALADHTTAQQIAALVEPFGNDVRVVTSTEEAFAVAAREQFDAIIAAASAADALAAIPGLKTPVLALMSAGMPMSVVARQILRWPAAPGALYASLGDMVGRSGDAPVPALQTPAIDAEAFAGLEKSLGLSTLLEILQSYVKGAEELSRALEAASRDGRWDEASRLAQDIAGAAGGLGLSALTAAARGVTQKVREGDDAGDLVRAVEAVTSEHHRVRKALTTLYPDLAA
ncbi:MAG: Hpt domain-containing protein [Alphaproteobacteria bacterium]|nr:Hpt domain-containing protein [Alphaproteobacteria bacterium]